jgi:AMMECR1 domain-containing protein
LRRINKFLLITLFFLIVTVVVADLWAQDDTGFVLSDKDKLYLIEVARKTAQVHLKEGRIFEPEDIPAALSGFNNKVYITIWVAGRVRGCQQGKKNDLVNSTILATIKAMTDRRFHPLTDEDELKNARLEFDIIIAETEIKNRNLTSLAKDIELGVYGIKLQAQNRQAYLRSSVPIINNWNLEHTLDVLARKAGLRRGYWKLQSSKLYRVNSINFIETESGFIDLFRGTNYILPEEVNERRILDSVIAGANWLMNNQLENGSYAYLYYPSRDLYDADNNILRQSGCAYALAFLGRVLGNKDLTTSSKKAIDFLIRHIRQTRDGKLAYVYFNTRASLGANGLLLLAIAELEDYSENDKYHLIAKKIADSILAMQNEDGSFDMYYESVTPEEDGAQDYYPGEAMLALVKFYQRERDERFIDCLRRAFIYYSNYWQGNKTTAFVPWQTSALVELYKITKDRKYADFVFQMNDWMLKRQYNETDSPYKDYIGGYRRKYFPGINTASYAEGMADAYWLAKLMKDNKRMESYGKSLLSSARFIMNLQFTKDNMYYISDPLKVEGGFKESIVANNLRNDYVQHAVLSLIKIFLYKFQYTDAKIDKR